jgi:hypothetical protein
VVFCLAVFSTVCWALTGSACTIAGSPTIPSSQSWFFGMACGVATVADECRSLRLGRVARWTGRCNSERFRPCTANRRNPEARASSLGVPYSDARRAARTNRRHPGSTAAGHSARRAPPMVYLLGVG